MRPRKRCLPKRGYNRQHNRQCDRHIHIEVAMLKDTPSAAIKWLTREQHRRKRNRRRYPVEHIPRGIRCPRPDRNAQKHDVHSRKARHSQPHQKLAACLIGFCRTQRPCIKLMRLVAYLAKHLDELARTHLFLSFNRCPLQCQVYAGTLDPRLRRKPPFNRRNTGSTVDRWQRQSKPRIFLRGTFGQVFCGRRRRAGRTG